MEDIKILLSQATRLCEKRQIEQNKKMHDGEMFNIFSVCKLRYDELKHSSIIAEILNPQGAHGQGKDYLLLFLDIIKKKVNDRSFRINIEDVRAYNDEIMVETECSVQEGRVDIVVKHGHVPFLIIENKLYAKDQEEQLNRYNKYAIRYSKEYEIVYLSLDGKEASEYSANGIDYIKMSYSQDIVQWLEMCIKAHEISPIVEILKQYKSYIEQITYGNMENNNDLFEIMAKNCTSVMMIAKDLWGFRDYLFDIFAKDLDSMLADKYNDFELDRSNLPYEFSIRSTKWKNARIYFGNESTRGTKGMWYGINCENVPVQNQLPCLNDDAPNNYWPFGTKYFDKFADWSQWNEEFMEGLANKEFVNYVFEVFSKIVSELDEKNIDLTKPLIPLKEA